MQRTIELNYNLLRFQLGVPAGTKIRLTETLESLTDEINVEAFLSQEFDHYQKCELQAYRRSGTDVITCSEVTESISFSYIWQVFIIIGINGMGDKISEQWFPNSMTGLQLSIPIFASGQRYSSIKKAQINLEKARTYKRYGYRTASSSGKTAKV